MAGFDREKIKAEMDADLEQKSDATVHALNLLKDFVPTANALGIEPTVVDTTSMVVQACGIALAKWPANADNKLVYYPVAIDGRHAEGVWLAGESQGLSITLDGQFFLKGKPVEPMDAAFWFARVCNFNEAAITDNLTEALKVRPATVQ